MKHKGCKGAPIVLPYKHLPTFQIQDIFFLVSFCLEFIFQYVAVTCRRIMVAFGMYFINKIFFSLYFLFFLLEIGFVILGLSECIKT
jgi:hypothetical protein